ncbi:MAG TPA: acyltransferase, partial [Asticcacaulis sp.]|nr:acyltransferase [Asticcacaulis sp.]
VVLYHYFLEIPGRQFCQFGTSGVDVFFLISGFVMVHSWREGQTPWDFWFKRILRIYPMYWLTLGILIVLTALGKLPLGISTYTSGDFLSSLFLYAQKSSNGGDFPLLPPAWTLVCEIYFYLLFGLCLWVKILTRIIGLLGFFFLICLVIWSLGGSKNYTISAYTNPILFEFLIGSILALVYRNSFTDPALIWLGKWGRIVAISLIAAGLSGIFANQHHVHGIISSEEHFTYFALPATLLMGGLLIAERSGLQLKNQGVFLLGSSSYAIYLFHLLFIDFSLRVFNRLMPLANNGIIEGLKAVSSIGIAIIGGIFIHLLIERLLIKKINGLLRNRHTFTTSPKSEVSGPAPSN